MECRSETGEEVLSVAFYVLSSGFWVRGGQGRVRWATVNLVHLVCLVYLVGLARAIS